MNGALLLFFLFVCIFVLLGIILYQQFAFRMGTQRKLKEISKKLEEILDRDSGEKVMVFKNGGRGMLKLIQLEWKKNRIGKYIRNALILAGFLCFFIFAMAYLGIADAPDTGVPDTAPGMEGISASIELFTSIAFLIFTCVSLARGGAGFGVRKKMQKESLTK